MNIYGIRGPYILSVATWEPRKNIELLVHTFMKMKEEGILAKYKLVLAGGMGWKNKRLHRLFKGKQLSDIVALGYVPDGHLPPLYSGAEALVFPSIYEGFGYPPAEAMACGLPTIVAKNLYYFKDGAMVMEESDEPAASGSILADAIIKLLDNPTISKKYSQKALSTAAEFTLDKTVEKTIKVYEDILS